MRRMSLITTAAAAGVAVSFALATPANAGYELVCEGYRPSSSHTTVKVDCSNRQAVIEALGNAWYTLRQQGIEGTIGDMCWKPYQRVKELHPAVPLDRIAGTFFLQCNVALQYAR